MLFVDAHEDIAWNAWLFNRDYNESALVIREREKNTTIPGVFGNALLGKTEWLRGQVGVIFSTIYVTPQGYQLLDWDEPCYANVQEAYKIGVRQMDIYHRMVEEHEHFTMIGTKSDLDDVLATWADDKDITQRRIGFVPSMEGADPIVEPEQAEEWFERGLRVVGLAWSGTQYAGGTYKPGPLTSAGMRLLEVMGDLGMIVDTSHLAEEAYYQVLERYEGVIIASHANTRRFIPTERGLSDEQVRMMADRGGVIGAVPYNQFLKPGWKRGDRKELVSLTYLVDAIDHICQLTGSVDHVGIGTDFDGAFGREHSPAEIDTIADMQKLQPLLAQRGFTEEQIQAIFHENWLRILRRALPDTV